MNDFRCQFVAICIGAAMAAGAVAQPASYDLVIRNGRVLDGAGNPWIRADIGVRDGKIARIGAISEKGQREIDASGHYVTPGWIDSMDQSGEVLLESGAAENKLRQGVTTVIAGEGGTPVPAAKITEYFARLEHQGISVNFGTYYSATQARIETMGEVAGTPTSAQMDQIKQHVRTAMDAGVFGLATALIYPPGSFQGTEELVQIVSVSASCGGIYATHMRNESADLLKGIGEAIEIGERAGVRVEIFHLKAAYQPLWGQLMPKALELIEQARARGVDVAADVYPYAASGTGLSSTVPNWVYEQGEAKAIKRLKDPKIRARLKREIQAGSQPNWPNIVEASGGWSGIMLANPFNPRYETYRGQSIQQIAATLKRDPADVAWDIVIEAMPNRAMALYFQMDEADVTLALRKSWTAIGSDASASVKLGEVDGLGLPHPRAYGTFPRIIAEYVKKRGVLTLEDAVRKMTSWPALRLGLKDRGLLREGLKADITVFDYDRIADKATWKEPTAVAEGIDYVVVNGQLVLDAGKHTGAKPGVVLKAECASGGSRDIVLSKRK